MGKHRRQFSATLKAKIAIEAIKGQRTVQEIASSYSVHPNQVTNWKKQLMDFSPEAFSRDVYDQMKPTKHSGEGSRLRFH